MSDALITKRLHVSGLTPALTADDLEKRISSFGTVRAVDGFGLPDGLGLPRKFGYITIETTTAKLARCLNLLSGSTWKGAKLRIGEAKPDFAERIARERSSTSDEPLKKKRKRSHGVGIEAPDMSLVSHENAASRAGWTVTPLGRILRPVKMRPERPLPRLTEIRDKKRVDGEKKVKKKVKDPDCRARRRTIDMTRWGSVNLKGVFLDADIVAAAGPKVDNVSADLELGANDSSEGETEAQLSDPEDWASMGEPHPTSELPRSTRPSSSPPASTRMSQHQAATGITQASLLAEEKSHSLDLLASLFDGKTDAEWIGREILESEVGEEETEQTRVFENVTGGKDEVVPMEDDGDGSDARFEEGGAQAIHVQDVESHVETGVKSKLLPATLATHQQPGKSTGLKDIFAPREDQAGFSLLGHLDLDLELDEDIPFSIPHPTQDQVGEAQAQAHVHAPSTTPIHHTTYPPLVPAPTTTYNPSLPFFFQTATTSFIQNKGHANRTQKVIPDWRDPSVSFFRAETEENIRERWERERGELTQGWKKRWREAGKMKRRKVGGATTGAGDWEG